MNVTNAPVRSLLFQTIGLVTFLVSSGQAFAQVVINEIFFDPPDNTQLTEFVELHNPSAAAVNLGGGLLEEEVEGNRLKWKQR